ncbi:hypothetical protein GLE_3980 [Lysobacter enzymogenes]|uniref:Uncharacterized protein n=1 Tax=Lysobacter enzymogenes TaxID=69 RepID=A0A0S2DL66_LYSEN|nr:hypothetical protein [Lysobacter enzymogenes]ALN59322.1 hypothetical protein GLE_3980 [Lysobacter enzymogenes]QCW27503.1 hypothetical protein FE772_19530 [Lysobacter enzymogenes]
MRVLSPSALAGSLALAVSFAVLAPAAHAAERHYVPLQQRLSAEQLKATGLDTLSPQQIQLLDQLLAQDQDAQVQEAVKKIRAERRGLPEEAAAREPVVAQLKDGAFRGWSVGTVLELENGQRWRVIEGSLYLGKPLAAPKVTIAPGMVGSTWYLQVEGQSPKAKVRRVE